MRAKSNNRGMDLEGNVGQFELKMSISQSAELCEDVQKQTLLVTDGRYMHGCMRVRTFVNVCVCVRFFKRNDSNNTKQRMILHSSSLRTTFISSTNIHSFRL